MNKIGFYALVILIGVLVFSGTAFAGTLPGSDASDKLEAAGTLLRLVDTAMFNWCAKILAGVLVLSAGWALKEQRPAIAVTLILGALLVATTPTWVKNLFDIGGSQSIFSSLSEPPSNRRIV